MEKSRTRLSRTRIRYALHFLIFALPAILLVACESGKPSVQINSPEAKLSAMFEGAASVFMNIENTGNANDALIGVSTDVSDAIVELHDVKDGRMVKTDAIRIPAGDTVQLRPGGLHIMIFKLPAMLKAGANISLVLQFQHSGEKKVAVQLTDNATAPEKGHGH